MRYRSMLQIKRTSITLREEDLVDLQEIILSVDHHNALAFLERVIYGRIKKSQLPYDCKYGTIGHRKRPYGWRQVVGKDTAA